MSHEQDVLVTDSCLTQCVRHKAPLLCALSLFISFYCEGFKVFKKPTLSALLLIPAKVTKVCTPCLRHVHVLIVV